MIKQFSFLVLLSFLSISLSAQKKKSDFKTNSISIFKNNSAFFIKEGTVAAKDGKYQMTDHFPTALFGTLWMHSPEGKLKHISSFIDTKPVTFKKPAINIISMLSLNTDKKLKLWLSDSMAYEGMITSIDTNQLSTEHRQPSPVIQRQIVTFKTNDEWLTFPVSDIKRVSFAEEPNQIMTTTANQNKHVLQVDFSDNAPQQRLQMMYLSNGIHWSPMYLLELESDTKAKLTLRAEMSNNVEDIEDTDINFVVGVPNFKYAKTKSALVDFVQQISGSNSNNFNNFSNTLQTQFDPNTYEVQQNTVGNVNNNPLGGVAGAANEDLYFYTINKVSLKKGGRAHYQLFNDKIDIAHIYETNIKANKASKGFYRKEFSFSVDKKNPVVHSVKLNNTTRYPWTTAPILVVNQKGETKPISQDLMTYTSIKGQTFVKLTEAPDVQIKHAEKEVARERKIKKIPNPNTKGFYHYDLVTIEGEVKVKNFKTKDIDLNIRRMIIGELEESSIEWLKAERVLTGYSFNKKTDVCWETSLGAGKELVIKYKYKIYISS